MIKVLDEAFAAAAKREPYTGFFTPLLGSQEIRVQVVGSMVVLTAVPDDG